MNTAKWITAVTCALSIAAASAQTQKHRPIAREALIEVVKSGALAQTDLVDYIEALGVNFQATPEDLELLTKLGATEIVRKAIAASYREPKPGEAPAAAPTVAPQQSARAISPAAPALTGTVSAKPAEATPRAPQIAAPGPRTELPPAQPSFAAQPPKAIRQERPVLPANVSAMVSRQVDVEVRVRVDKTGKVVAAEPLIPAGMLNSYLGAAAVAAAKLWTFEPAQPNDQNVADSFILKFTFQPRRK